MDRLKTEEEEREKIDKAFQANPTEVEAQWRQLKVAEESCQQQRNHLVQCKHRQKERQRRDHIICLCEIHLRKVQDNDNIKIISDIFNSISPNKNRNAHKNTQIIKSGTLQDAYFRPCDMCKVKPIKLKT
jgi:hypothetical protein